MKILFLTGCLLVGVSNLVALESGTLKDKVENLEGFVHDRKNVQQTKLTIQANTDATNKLKDRLGSAIEKLGNQLEVSHEKK